MSKPYPEPPWFARYIIAHVEAAGLSRIDVEVILDALATLVEQVDIAYLWRPQLRDVGDDMVMEAAVNGRAQAIVTFNTADFGTKSSRFGIGVLKPSDILRRVRWTPPTAFLWNCLLRC